MVREGFIKCTYSSHQIDRQFVYLSSVTVVMISSIDISYVGVDGRKVMCDALATSVYENGVMEYHIL